MKEVIINSSLVPVGNINDLFHNGKPQKNILLFLFLKSTGQFLGTYETDCRYKYHTKELHYAIHHCYLYKLIEYEHHNDFNIQVLLYQAHYLQIFEAKNQLMINKTYYIRSKDYMKGPYQVRYTDYINNAARFQDAIDKEIIYLVSHSQDKKQFNHKIAI